MLLLGRKEGEGLHVGRMARVTFSDVHSTGESGTVTVVVEHEPGVAVSTCMVTGFEHLKAQLAAESAPPGPRLAKQFVMTEGEDLRIGRGVEILLLAIHSDYSMRIGIGAPRHVAVSRDDFTLEQHEQYQQDRERDNPK